MIANPTTLILGAGASAPAYPLGKALVDAMIGSYQKGSPRERLARRFRNSLLPSIDAFLAEEGNSDLAEEGRIAIAEALLPCEAKAPPPWYATLFDAIRAPSSPSRSQRLQVVTFNYDLSLEHFLWMAFVGAYKISGEEARARMDESIEIIHVYGQLGSIATPRGDRSYNYEHWPNLLAQAASGIEIIGRKPDDPRFNKAHEAIARADFLAILGFGYDETNVANLRLPELAKDKILLSTGYSMGYGMRAWLRHIGLPKIRIAPPDQTVESFLSKSAFLHWANIPGCSAAAMLGAVTSEANSRKFALPG